MLESFPRLFTRVHATLYVTVGRMVGRQVDKQGGGRSVDPTSAQWAETG